MTVVGLLLSGGARQGWSWISVLLCYLCLLASFSVDKAAAQSEFSAMLAINYINIVHKGRIVKCIQYQSVCNLSSSCSSRAVELMVRLCKQ